MRGREQKSRKRVKEERKRDRRERKIEMFLYFALKEERRSRRPARLLWN